VNILISFFRIIYGENNGDDCDTEEVSSFSISLKQLLNLSMVSGSTVF